MARAASKRASALLDLISPRFFKAFGDPTRLGILTWLAACRRECTVGEIADKCSVGVSVVSRHLSQLRDVGILSSEKRGKEVYYRVCVDEVVATLRDLADALENCCKP